MMHFILYIVLHLYLLLSLTYGSTLVNIVDSLIQDDGGIRACTTILISFNSAETFAIMEAIKEKTAFLTFDGSNLPELSSISKCVGLLVVVKIDNVSGIVMAEKLALKLGTQKRFVYIVNHNIISDLMHEVKNKMDIFYFEAVIVELQNIQSKIIAFLRIYVYKQDSTINLGGQSAISTSVCQLHENALNCINAKIFYITSSTA
jgi:hypothetical protein